MAVLVAVDHPLDLSAYLYQLYQGQQLCDLILTSTDNTEFYTHRIVMSSASTYLHQLFINHSPIASCIRLDLSTEVLRLLIDFMYTGQLNVTDQVRPQLQHAAISLQIHALEKLLCTKFAESSLSGSCNPARAVSVSQSQTSDWMKLVPERSEDSSFGQISSAGSEPHTKEAASVLDQTFDGENDINSKPTHQQGGHYVKSETRYSEVDKRTSHQVGNISSHSLTAVTSQSVQASSFSSQLLGQDGGGINSEVKQESFLCSTPYSDITGTGVHSGRQEQGSVRRGSREIKKQKGSARQTIAQNWKKNVFVPKSRTRIICDICKATFMSHNTLRCHRLTRHGPNVRENTAAVCLRKCYDTLCHIRRQCEPLVVRGDDMVLDGARYSCKMCSSRFRYYSQCRLHVHRRHSRMENPLPRLFRAMSVTMNRQSGRYRVKEKRRKSPLLTQLKAREEEASKRIDCDKCHKSFSTERTLKDHLARVHKIQRSKLKETNRKVAPSDFQCVKCGRSTSDSQTLIRHLQHVHHLDRQEAKHEADNIPFKMACVEPDCQFCSNNLTDMDSHMTSVHPAVQLTCDQCPKTFTVDISLKRHIITKHKPRHGKSKPFCSLCNKGFMKPYYLKLHEYRKHNIPHPQIKEYKCEHEGCQYRTISQYSLRIHGNKHVKEKPYSCSVCGMKLKTQLSVKKHMSKVHLNIRPFLCQMCAQSFGEYHIRHRHPTELEYRCQQCQYATANKNLFFTHTFNVHKVRSLGDKRLELKCPHCVYTTLLHNRYKTHLNSHSNTRDYACQECQKTFISASTLRAHTQWHHSDVAFLCTQCEYKTKTKQKLNEHIRIQHQLKGFKPYKCPYCEFCCATGGNCRKHVRQVHKGQTVTYIRDDVLIAAARVARKAGQTAPLSFDVYNETADKKMGEF